MTKPQLIQKLQEHSIMMNPLGERLLSDDRLIVSDQAYGLDTVELTVRDLGFQEGATSTRLFNQAGQLGLALCPLELGPFLRLEYLNQAEGFWGKPVLPNQAPYGSITIASEMISEAVGFPKGFYLRKVEGVLWLRGYVADGLHVWAPDDHFVFVKGA